MTDQPADTDTRIGARRGGRLLSIYLDDHWAAAAGGLRLVQRSLRSNRDTRWSSRLDWLASEIETDERTLARVRDELGANGGGVKRAAAVIGETLGRLKLNGRVVGYSPLSRVIELEALVGVIAKRSLWVSLEAAELAGQGSVAALDTAALTRRAEEQLEVLSALHREAAVAAFGPR
jgi:hypothetical protein